MLVWFPLPPSPSSLHICWCFLCWWVSSSRRYSGVPSFHPLFFYVRPPLGFGCACRALIRSLPGACGLRCLQDEEQTPPGGWAHSLVAGHSPPGGARNLSSLQDEVRTLSGQWVHSPDGWQDGEETGAVAAGEFPKVPRRVFFFLGKSCCSILWLPPYKEGPVLSHSPAVQLGRGLSGSGLHLAQLSTLLNQHLQSPCVYHLILIPLPVTSGTQVSHSVTWSLFGRGGGS